MKIRMKTLAAGPDFLYYPGQEVDVLENVALTWIKQGNAEPVITERETATVESPEQAVAPKTAPRRRKDERGKTHLRAND